MIFDYMNIGFLDDEWIEIIKEYRMGITDFAAKKKRGLL